MIIDVCSFSIHDLSRTDLDSRTNLPRFNMPFELGLYLGCKHFGGRRHSDKRTLVMDSEPYRYQKFLSDLAGRDIEAHNGEPAQAIKSVRNWLATHTKRTLAGPKTMAERFTEFTDDLRGICDDVDFNIDHLSFRDYGYCCRRWLENYDKIRLQQY
jgi:hypothetical protein